MEIDRGWCMGVATWSRGRWPATDKNHSMITNLDDFWFLTFKIIVPLGQMGNSKETANAG